MKLLVHCDLSLKSKQRHLGQETAGCLFLDKNSITSINLLLSLNYHCFIIYNKITAYFILL